MTDTLRSLTRERAYELSSRVLANGCMRVQINPRRDGEHFDVDAGYSQGPYTLAKFENIQEIADEFGLQANFSLNGQGMTVWFR
jgi:hypothetical protein